jgi:hypothetical protein
MRKTCVLAYKSLRSNWHFLTKITTKRKRESMKCISLSTQLRLLLCRHQSRSRPRRWKSWSSEWTGQSLKRPRRNGRLSSAILTFRSRLRSEPSRPSYPMCARLFPKTSTKMLIRIKQCTVTILTILRRSISNLVSLCNQQ